MDPNQNRAAWLHPKLEGVDSFSFVSFVPNGGLVRRNKRAKGGVFTLLAAVTFLTLMLTLILQRAANNTLTVVASNFLRFQDQVFANTLPFYASPTWGSGVQVRVWAAGPRCGELSAWRSQPNSFPPSIAPAGTSGGGAWTYSVTRDCGGSNVSQHVFKCADCRFASTSALTLGFDFTCQALLVEVGALDGEGVLYTDSSTPSAGITEVEGVAGMMSSAIVSEVLLTSIYNDTFRGGSRRGYALSPGAFPQVRFVSVPITTDVRVKHKYLNGTTTAFGTYTPDGNTCCRNVSLTVALAANMFYTMRTDSERVTATQMLSSIIGLAGVLAFFSKALYYTDLYENVVRV